MNYLQLAERFCDECNVPRSSLSSVSGQSGELLRMVNWINSAWMDIQSAHQDWQWLRASASCTTTNAQATYSPTTDFSLTDFGMWARNTFRIYTTATGYSSEVFLEYVDYEDWRNTYQFGSLRTSYSQPFVFTITPTKTIGLGPVPTSDYTVIGDYFKAPSEMSADDDTPILPTQFHLAIVYRAMMFYGIANAAAEIYQHGEAEFNKMMRRMAADRLPEVTISGTLA